MSIVKVYAVWLPGFKRISLLLTSGHKTEKSLYTHSWSPVQIKDYVEPIQLSEHSMNSFIYNHERKTLKTIFWVTLAIFITSDSLTDIRQSLASPKLIGKRGGPNLPDLLNTAETAILDQVKSVLSNVQVCVMSDRFIISDMMLV